MGVSPYIINGETSPGSTPRSERLKPFLSGLRKVCDISIRLRHRTPSNQDVLQWRVFEALLYSVRTDLRLADPAVTIFNACSSSLLKFRCFSCTVLTKLRDKLCNSTIFLRVIHIPLCVNCLLTWMTSHMSYLLWPYYTGSALTLQRSIFRENPTKFLTFIAC